MIYDADVLSMYKNIMRLNERYKIIDNKFFDDMRISEKDFEIFMKSYEKYLRSIEDSINSLSEIREQDIESKPDSLENVTDLLKKDFRVITKEDF